MDCTTPPIAQEVVRLFDLPIELLEEIFSYIYIEKDLQSLYKTSKLTRNLIEPKLHGIYRYNVVKDSRIEIEDFVEKLEKTTTWKFVNTLTIVRESKEWKYTWDAPKHRRYLRNDTEEKLLLLLERFEDNQLKKFIWRPFYPIISIPILRRLNTNQQNITYLKLCIDERFADDRIDTDFPIESITNLKNIRTLSIDIVGSKVLGSTFIFNLLSVCQHKLERLRLMAKEPLGGLWLNPSKYLDWKKKFSISGINLEKLQELHCVSCHFLSENIFRIGILDAKKLKAISTTNLYFYHRLDQKQYNFTTLSIKAFSTASLIYFLEHYKGLVQLKFIEGADSNEDLLKRLVPAIAHHHETLKLLYTPERRKSILFSEDDLDLLGKSCPLLEVVALVGLQFFPKAAFNSSIFPNLRFFWSICPKEEINNMDYWSQISTEYQHATENKSLPRPFQILAVGEIFYKYPDENVLDPKGLILKQPNDEKKNYAMERISQMEFINSYPDIWFSLFNNSFLMDEFDIDISLSDRMYKLKIHR